MPPPGRVSSPTVAATTRRTGRSESAQRARLPRTRTRSSRCTTSRRCSERELVAGAAEQRRQLRGVVADQAAGDRGAVRAERSTRHRREVAATPTMPAASSESRRRTTAPTRRRRGRVGRAASVAWRSQNRARGPRHAGRNKVPTSACPPARRRRPRRRSAAPGSRRRWRSRPPRPWSPSRRCRRPPPPARPIVTAARSRRWSSTSAISRDPGRRGSPS